jgi:cold shock CspA family protein
MSEEGTEYFVHWKSIVTISDRGRKFLVKDEDIEFDLIETDKGTQAINIVRLHP